MRELTSRSTGHPAASRGARKVWLFAPLRRLRRSLFGNRQIGGIIDRRAGVGGDPQDGVGDIAARHALGHQPLRAGDHRLGERPVDQAPA